MSVIGVVFVVIAIGYVSVQTSMFSEIDIETFGKYIVNFALPALIFQAMSGHDVREILNIGYLSAYLGGSLLIFAGGYAWSRRVSGLTPMASIFQSMGMSCSNSGYVGYPILLMAWLGLLAVAAADISVVDQRLAQAAILMAAMPAMSIYPILAQRYRQQRLATLALLMMTGLSFFSISALLGLLEALPPG